MLRYVAAAGLLALAAGCSAPPPPTASQRANTAAFNACRASADGAYLKQHRYLLSERDTTDSPFSTSGDPGITTRGLPDRYAYDVDLSNCLAATPSTQPNGTETTTAPGGGVQNTSPVLH